jgi:hypothetical protein
LDEQLQRVNEFFQRVMDRGMEGKAGAVWPVIVRRWGNVGWSDERNEDPKYVHHYPESFFRNLKTVNRLDLYSDKKSERVQALKMIVDKLIAGEIDIYLYHLGLHLIYNSLSFRRDEDFKAMGRRREEYLAKLPRYELKSNDDFFGTVWSDLILRRYPDVGEEIVQVPTFKEIRMLFTPDHFGAHTGRHYSDADWLEPVPGIRLDVKKWVGEKDPMTPQPKKQGMIEGPITLGHEGGASGLRHFVGGEPVRTGSYIEIKFGDGWIPGRYEWSFDQGSPIQIHSGRNECFYIEEGHLVRIRG